MAVCRKLGSQSTDLLIGHITYMPFLHFCYACDCMTNYSYFVLKNWSGSKRDFAPIFVIVIEILANCAEH